MEIVARKTKELQIKTLISALIPLCLGIIVLIAEIALVTTLGWRGFVDVSYLLLMAACFTFFAWEVWQYAQMSKVPEEVITYEEGELTFSGILTCKCEEVDRVSYKFDEESDNKWGTLSFTHQGKMYACPMIADIEEAFARLIELGVKPKATVILKTDGVETEIVASEEVVETPAEEVAEEVVEEVAAEEVTEEPVEEVAEEVAEEPTEEAQEEVAEEVATAEEPVEEPAEEVAEETTEEAPAEETAEENKAE